MGESFGGILACNVALELIAKSDESNHHATFIQLQGLILINPATCYNDSRLKEKGPAVAQLPWYKYPTGLLQLLPLFTDPYSVQQLLLILTAQALPSIVNDSVREAYMGRVACSLPWVIPVVTPSTLQWRLQEWLQVGCDYITPRLHTINKKYPDLRTLIVAGELDETLPSVDEATRLSTLLPNAKVHVVPGAGHASTSRSRVDLAACMRSHYHSELEDGRTKLPPGASRRTDAWYGMQERYDSAKIGLNPLLYWSSPDYYRKYRP